MVKVLQAQDIQTPRPARVSTGRRASAEDFGAAEARALGAAGDALDVVGQVAGKHAQRRQKAEDKAFLDRASLELDLGYQRIRNEEQDKARAGADQYVDTVKQRFESETNDILTNVKEKHGYRPSDEMMAEAHSRALRRQRAHLGQAITYENNERVRFLRERLDESVSLIADSEAQEGNVQGAIARVQETIDSYADVLTPADVAETRDNAAQVLFDRFRAETDPETFKSKADAIIAAFKEERDDEGATFTGKAADDNLVGAIIQQESDGNPNAISHAGAIGLMQVMPATGREIARELGDAEAQGMSNAEFKEYLKRPEVSREYGTHYINKMLERYDGDLDAALIAYNGGPKRADRWIAAGRDDSVIPRETRRYYKEVKGRMDGAPEDSSVQGAFAELVIRNRDVLQRDADRALEGRRFQMKRVLEDDLESIRRTGQGVEGVELETFSRVLTSNQINRYVKQRRQNKAVFEATHDIPALTEQQISDRLDSLEPEAGEADFAFKAEVFDEATDIANDIREARENDPAKSVAEHDAVKEAAEAVDPDDPRTVQALVQRRLDAQERVGIPEAARRPITRAEAKVIVAPIKDLEGRELIEGMEELAIDLQDRYGNLTDEVMTSAIEMIINSRSSAEQLSAIVDSFVRKGVIPQADLMQMREELETEAIQRATSPAAVANEAGEAFSSSDLSGSAQELESFLSTQTPPDEAIRLLKQHPEMAPQFDAKYGTGSAQQYLEENAAQ